MGNMFARLWAMVGAWLGVFESFGMAAQSLANVAKETAGAYEDESRANRILQAKANQKQLEA